MLSIYLPYDLQNPLLDIYINKYINTGERQISMGKRKRKTCSRIFLAALIIKKKARNNLHFIHRRNDKEITVNVIMLGHVRGQTIQCGTLCQGKAHSPGFLRQARTKLLPLCTASVKNDQKGLEKTFSRNQVRVE